jgi:DivIVA domain-containing protein
MVKATEVKQKEFGKSLFGYSKSEVDSFVKNEVVKQLELHERILADYKENKYKETAKKYEDSQKELVRILTDAKKQAAALKKQAEEEAQHIKTKAGLEVKAQLEKAQQDATAIILNATELADREKAQASRIAHELLVAANAEKDRIEAEQLELQRKIVEWKNIVKYHTNDVLSALSDEKLSDVQDVVVKEEVVAENLGTPKTEVAIEVEPKVAESVEVKEIIHNENNVVAGVDVNNLDLDKMVANTQAMMAEEEAKLLGHLKDGE